MTLEHKPFEIFSGTGGVGKTTLATSRAIHLAQAGKKVLLITIDPAKRLKELLNIKDSHAGEVVTVKDPFNEEKDLKLDVELMSAPSTFERMAIKNNCEEVLNNRILSILTKPYGGLNEILAIVELNLQFERNIYDVIVLDTPPGSHFLDFLDSVSRIQMFFDQSFVDIFTYLGKKVESSQTANFGKKMMNKVLSSGVKKLLKYLGKVTGDQFVDDFIDAILAIYKTKSSFLDAINLQEKLKSKDMSYWFLVTNVEQNKLKEALDLKKRAKDIITNDSIILLNKCNEALLRDWTPDVDSTNERLKNSLLKNETNLKQQLKNEFKNIIEFPEVFDISPLEHVKKLSKTWLEH